ncbi:MAG: low temperature requirement protein A [Bacilli bacterium]|jgi:low temperature requirement protein LtrA|nr:low temperature requirement protein A [Bacilli bacterium]
MIEKKVTWLELFFDLIFVVAIASTNHWLLNIEEEQSLEILFKYFLMVIPLWWAWTGQTMFYNRFDKYLKVPIIFMGLQILAIVIMCASFNLDFDKTYFTFILGYALSRLVTIIEYIITYKRNDDSNNSIVSKTLASCLSVGLLITLLSLFIPSPLRYVIMYLGIFLDLILPLIYHSKLKLVPVHIGHLAERLGLLVMISFGEAIVSVVSFIENNSFSFNNICFLLAMLLALILLFLSYYSEYDDIINKRHQGSGQLLLYSHLFIISSIMLIACLIHIGFFINESLLLYLIGFVALVCFIFFKNIIFEYYDYLKEKIAFKRIFILIIVIIGLGIFGLIFKEHYFVYYIILIVITSIIDIIVLKNSRVNKKD